MPDRLARVYPRYSLRNHRPAPETTIERMMRDAFDVLGVDAKEQGRVGRYWPDFIVSVDGVLAVVECDGPVHLTPKQQLKDRHKDAAYKAAGLPVFRFTDVEIRKSAVACARRVVDTLRGAHAPAEQLADPALS